MSYYDDIIFFDCAEYEDYSSRVIVRPHESPHWEFALHFRGNLILQRGDGPVRRFSVPVFHWRSHQQRYYHGMPSGEKRGHLYIVLGGARAQRGYEHLCRLFPDGYLELGEDRQEAEFFLETMRSMIPVIRLRDEAHKHTAVLGFEKLIAEATEYYYRHHSVSEKEDPIQKLIAGIRTRPLKDYDFLNRIPLSLCMSYSSFRARFKALTGRAPRQFLMDCRLQHAIELLNSTELHIKDIACRCGFENSISFFRFFRKRMGTTPEKYRFHLQNSYLDQ